MGLLTKWLSRSKKRAQSSSDPLLRVVRKAFGEADAVGNPYQHHAILNRVVHLIASNIASIEFRLFEGTDQDPQLIRSGPWYQLFLRPNRNLYKRDLWLTTITTAALDGDCLWVFEGAGDSLDKSEIPTEIWPVRGSLVRENLSADKLSVESWTVSTSAGVATIPSSSALLLKYQIDPDNPFRGTCPLRALRSILESDVRATEYNRSFFTNAATPSLLVKYPKEAAISPSEVKAVREELESRYTGYGKSHRSLVLSEGGDAEVLGQTHKDMEFMAQLNWAKDTIALAYGVPNFYLGEEQQLTYASAEEAGRKLWVTTLLPIVVNIEDSLEAWFDGRGTTEQRARARVQNTRVVWGKFDIDQVQALKRDFTERLNQAKTAADLGIPFNEINERLQLGFAAQPGGDIGLIPTGRIPIALAIEGYGVPGATVPGLQPNAPTPDGVPPAAAPPPPEKPTAADQTLPDTTPDAQPERQRDAILVDPAQVRQERLGLIHRKGMLPLDEKFHAAIKAGLHRFRTSVMEALRKWVASRIKRDSDQTLDGLLDDLKTKFDEQMKGRMKPLYVQGVRIGADTVGEQLPDGLTHFTVEDPSVVQFLAQKEIRVTEITKTVVDELRTSLAEGMAATENLEALTDRVRDVMNTSSSRALTIARTESAQTVNGSRQLAMKAEGVERTEWLTAHDAHVRETHKGMDGQVRPLNEPFSNGCLYPGDVAGPAEEVINCRCSSAPVLD